MRIDIQPTSEERWTLFKRETSCCRNCDTKTKFETSDCFILGCQYKKADSNKHDTNIVYEKQNFFAELICAKVIHIHLFLIQMLYHILQRYLFVIIFRFISYCKNPTTLLNKHENYSKYNKFYPNIRRINFHCICFNIEIR